MMIIRLLVGAAVILGVLLTLAGALTPLIPRADFANHLRPFTLAGTGALLAVALAARISRAAWWSAALTFLNAVLFLLPLQWSAETSRGQALASPQHRDIKIVTFNMAWTPRPVDNVAHFLLKEDADIVLLQEVTEAHAAALSPLLKPRYPHSHACAVPRSCTQAMFAKRPWMSVQHVERANSNPEMMWARFDDPELGAFGVYSLHVAWPFVPETQARHVDRLIALGRSITEPAILAGDFNMTPWSYQLQRLLASTGLRRHTTFLRSWPTDGQFRLPAPLFLIDHLLTTADIQTITIGTGPNLGSDHLPIVARLRLAAKPY
jgi:endonuclease/exonuclease/phosphatase (EEP) superfamily protein YafD